MSGLLERHSYDATRVEARRLGIVVVALLALSACWYGVRGALIDRLARSSVGCVGRDSLIITGLRRAGYDVGKTDQVRHQSLSGRGWVAWSATPHPDFYGGISLRTPNMQTTVVDSEFRLMGIAPTIIKDPPMDIDGDGCWEVHIVGLAVDKDEDSPWEYHAVLRLHPTYNELIWLGSVYNIMRLRAYAIVHEGWLDDDGDGISELAFYSEAPGYMHESPPVATFGPECPGGLLRAHKYTPGYGIVTAWDPPADGPIRLDGDEDLLSLFRELLPVKETSW
jgi:hypothetical protein